MLYILLESGNGRTQREFIEIIAKINGIELDFSYISGETMIIASHDSINGNYDKFMEMFKKYSMPLSKEEQIKNIKTYILDKNLKTTMLNLLK
ncbi:MAG: hypothetical protein FWF46_04400 [Oscillospiraceae bacterium]|nr:hypothetical protein [Oscillospiraceae bacterium]